MIKVNPKWEGTNLGGFESYGAEWSHRLDVGASLYFGKLLHGDVGGPYGISLGRRVFLFGPEQLLAVRDALTEIIERDGLEGQ